MAEQAEQARESIPVLTDQQFKELQRQSGRENLARAWFKFSRNPLSIIGGVTTLIVILLAIFAPYVTPYPEHATMPFTDFANAGIPPSSKNLLGSALSGCSNRRIAWIDRWLLPGDTHRYFDHAHHRYLPGRASPNPGVSHRLSAEAEPFPLDDRCFTHVVALVYAPGLWPCECPTK